MLSDNLGCGRIRYPMFSPRYVCSELAIFGNAIMKRRSFIASIFALGGLVFGSSACAGTFETPPKMPAPESHYVFYLHGAIVEGSDGRPVHPQYGPYEYRAIVDFLAANGFEVISEIRPAGTDVREYAEKVVEQVRYLQQQGVPNSRISVIGASKGGMITAFVSSHLGEADIRYVFLAGLFGNAANTPDIELSGKILAVYDNSDITGQNPQAYFDRSTKVSESKVVVTDTGLGHGLIYTANPAWTAEVLAWLEPGPPATAP